MEGGCDLKGEWFDLKVIGQDVVHGPRRSSTAESRRPPREHASASGTSAIVLPLAAPAASAIATNER